MTNSTFKKKVILYVVNVDWFFLSHRLPLALKALDEGYRVIVLTSDTGCSDEIESYGIEFIAAPFLEKKGSFFEEFYNIYRLKSLYSNLKPDLIHHVTIRPVLYGSFAARLSKVPAVVNALSGLGYIYINNTLANRVLRLFFTKLFKWGFSHPNSTLILQNQDDEKLFIDKKLISANQIKIIKGSGVDTEKFVPTSKNEKKEGLDVAFIGRMLWDKGVGEFVEAAKILHDKDTPANFHLYGAPYETNPMSIPLHKLQEWENGGIVEVHGHVSEMSSELNNIDIVCLPSYREGLPKALIEAASAGKPIVTTDVPGCREVVKDGYNGYLVSPKDSESLALKVKDLIESPEKRKEYGLNSRKMAVEKFSVDDVINKTMKIYRSLLS